MAKDMAELAELLIGEFAQLHDELAGIKDRLVKLEAGQVRIETAQAVVAARLDEQRATVNALIPKRTVG